MKVRFESIGLYLPEKIVQTQELISRMKTKPVFDFEKITGIKSRRVRGDNENSLVLALNAAEDCLSRSIYSASELDVIIYCSITRFKENSKFLFEPSMSLFIKRKLGANVAINFDISNACAGMITGVYILKNMIESGSVKNGMVISGESITHIADTAVKEIQNQIDDQFASLTVGDSGAACIMDRAYNDRYGIDFIDFRTFAHYSELCFGMPSNMGTGIAMYTDTKAMSSRELMDIWPRYLEEVLEKNNMTYDPNQWDYIITHQIAVGTIHKYLQVGEEYFKKKMPPTLISVDEYGNTSTTTHFVVLHKYLKEKKLKEGSRVLIMSTASGIQMGFMSFSIHDMGL